MSQRCAGSSISAIARLTHHLATEPAHRLDREVLKFLFDPLGRQLVRGFRLLGIAEDRDRRDGPLAGADGLVGDEAGLLSHGLRKVAVDAMHEILDRAGSDTIGSNAQVHGCSSRVSR
jgi:hypothetical protein